MLPPSPRCSRVSTSRTYFEKLVGWRTIRLHRPELVITWDGFRPGFNHRDHRNTGRATYDAIYPASDDDTLWTAYIDYLSPLTRQL